MPALVPPYGEIPPMFWQASEWNPANWTQPCGAIMAGGFLLVVLGAVIWMMVTPKPAIQLAPKDIALAELAKLENEPEDGNILSKVSQVVRRYVGDNFALPTNEFTTAEFCAVIAKHPQIKTDLAETLESFLRECDVRKFSPATVPTPANAVRRAQELIGEIDQAAHRQDAGGTPP